MKRKYLAVYEHRSDGYSGYVLDFPGCNASASSLEEMRSSMREAIETFRSKMIGNGDEVPEPTTRIVHFPPASEGHGIDHWVVEAHDLDPSNSSPKKISLRMTAVEVNGED